MTGVVPRLSSHMVDPVRSSVVFFARSFLSVFSGAFEQARRQRRHPLQPQRVPVPDGHPEAHHGSVAGGHLAKGRQSVS